MTALGLEPFEGDALATSSRTRPASTSTASPPRRPCRSTRRCRRSTASASCSPTSPTRSRPTGRARSTTSTPSSSTTCASPCAEPASVLATAKHVLPADVVTRAGARSRWLGDLTEPAARPRRVRPRVGPLRPTRSATARPPRSSRCAPARGTTGRRHATLGRTASPDAERRVSHLRAGSPTLAEPSTRGGGHADRPLGRSSRKRIAARPAPPPRARRAITPTSPAEQVHDLRKDAKKLRYLLECFGGLLPDRRAQGVREAPQGAAGQPRRAPGRRGPRGADPRVADELRRSATGRDRTSPSGQLVERLEQPQHRRPGRVRRALRRVRQPTDPRGPARRARRDPRR